jgi:formylmethanofuran--tetrahydromethanopterin N-formyltransferase
VNVNIDNVQIDDTFAEAFRMRYARLIVTAADDYWLAAAVAELAGYGSSVIGCDAEVGVERYLAPEETPDLRPGAAVLLFGFSAEALAAALVARVGQSVMTCATSAVFDGIPPEMPESLVARQAGLQATVEHDGRVPLGKHLRYFGDGYQKSKQLDGRRSWRIPVMDGEFLVADSVGVAKGIGGGNIIVQGIDAPQTLAAARRGVESVATLAGVITPFPGGVARSGSKVGSRYKKLVASTADAFCPTLRGRTPSKLHPQAACALEIVIDGVNEASVGAAMASAIRACAGEGIVAISAGNYGGKLGKFHFRLHDLLSPRSS